jgi:hypothetical protein
LDPLLAARLALRTGDLLDAHAAVLRDLAGKVEGPSAEERIFALARLGELRGKCAELARSVPLQLQEAVCLAEGNLEQAITLPMGDGDDAVLRRMTLLLKLAEDKPEQRVRAQVLGEALFAAHLRVARLQALHARLTRDSTWTPITSIQTSAGLRYIEVKGWAPESPSLRTRKALLASLTSEEQILSGYDRFGVSLTNLRPTELKVDLSMEDVDYLPPMSLTAVYQLDQGIEKKITLTSEAPHHSLRIPIPTGEHSVRVWIEQPLANQFLRIRVQEVRSDQGNQTKKVTSEGLVETVERAYHLATHQEPLRLSLAGPA